MDLKSFKILSDENIASSVVAYLRNRGVEVIDAKEEKWFGKPDSFLLEQSYLRKQFVLTHDSDFGTLAINQGEKFFGIIYLRVKNQMPQNVINVIDRLFRLNLEVLPETIIVVKERTDDSDIFVRVRHHNLFR